MIAKIRYILLLMMASVIVISCSKDKLDENAPDCTEPVTYDDVRLLLSGSCGYVGCHNGIDRGENFNNFPGLQTYLSNGSFGSRVFESADMPPSYATGPTELTAEEIELLQCWQQNDFSEF